MNKICTLALSAFTATAALAVAEPAQKIDVSQLPQQAKMIEDVVVPVPSEIFGVLDKLGRPVWTEEQRRGMADVKPIGDQAQISLLLGTVIAEGFIAVEAEDATEVKNIGKTVLTLSRAIGVEKSVLKRSNSIIAAAEDKNWANVRRELDGALSDVKKAMMEIRSEQLSQLVSLGGWLRGTEALTSVVCKSYSQEKAELLHQPVLLDYFEKRLSSMRPKVKESPLVIKVQKGLSDIRPLVGLQDGTQISEKSVQEIGSIAKDLVKSINSKAQ